MGTYQADWFLRFVGLEDFPMVTGGEDKQLSRNTTIIWRLFRDTQEIS